MKTFFFYDLETSGFSPREDRIMQFAAQRTDLDLNLIGDPINILIKLNDDVLPSPGALMVTKISPQKTVEEGYSEAEFAKMCIEDFFTPDTIAVGYNNIRFDDEHMRYLFWRNFYDPYEWQYKDGRSKWDLLDVVRMVRALRPEGVNWPFLKNSETGDFFASNKLELLTKENGIEHENAHDALADVVGLIEVARLLKCKQPQMFEYMFKMRTKNEIQNLINLDKPEPFVYASGRYSSQFDKTTVAFPIAPEINRNVLVWDLRASPLNFADWSVEQILENLNASWEKRQESGFEKIPVKVLNYGRCPAVAKIGAIADDDVRSRLKIDMSQIQQNIADIKKNPQLIENIRTAFENRAKSFFSNKDEERQPEAQLYEGFLNESDKRMVEAVRNASKRELADFHPNFIDERLPNLLLHYKARSFPKTLSAEEKAIWEDYRAKNLQKMIPGFLEEMAKISERKDLTREEEFILEELKLWLENVYPEFDN